MIQSPQEIYFLLQSFNFLLERIKKPKLYLLLVELCGGEVHDRDLFHSHYHPMIVVKTLVDPPERAIAYLV